jgi:hypothetical protein
MSRVVGYSGFPSSITTAANHARWTGHDFQAWAADWNIDLKLTTPQNHTRRGLVERQIATLSTQLRNLRDPPVRGFSMNMLNLSITHPFPKHGRTIPPPRPSPTLDD